MVGPGASAIDGSWRGVAALNSIRAAVGTFGMKTTVAPL